MCDNRTRAVPEANPKPPSPRPRATNMVVANRRDPAGHITLIARRGTHRYPQCWPPLLGLRTPHRQTAPSPDTKALPGPARAKTETNDSSGPSWGVRSLVVRERSTRRLALGGLLAGVADHPLAQPDERVLVAARNGVGPISKRRGPSGPTAVMASPRPARYAPRSGARGHRSEACCPAPSRLAAGLGWGL